MTRPYLVHKMGPVYRASSLSSLSSSLSLSSRSPRIQPLTLTRSLSSSPLSRSEDASIHNIRIVPPTESSSSEISSSTTTKQQVSENEKPVNLNNWDTLWQEIDARLNELIPKDASSSSTTTSNTNNNNNTYQPPKYRQFSPLESSTYNHTTSGSIKTQLTLQSLMATGMHLGHNASDWHPKMLPYILGERNGIHIINLEHSLSALKRAINVTKEVAMNNGKIVFVGTKPTIHKITVEAAKRCRPVGFFVTDWKPGTITNKERVLRRSTGYDPDNVSQQSSGLNGGGNILAASGNVDNIEVNGNIDEESDNTRRFNRPTPSRDAPTPDLIILLDTFNVPYIVNEANLANIPVIALCDTDVDPTVVPYPIPGNDDSLPAVELVAGVLSLAAKEGYETRFAVENATKRYRFERAMRNVAPSAAAYNASKSGGGYKGKKKVVANAV